MSLRRPRIRNSKIGRSLREVLDSSVTREFTDIVSCTYAVEWTERGGSASSLTRRLLGARLHSDLPRDRLKKHYQQEPRRPMIQSPAFCRPAAFASLASEGPTLDQTRSLFRAAWAVALHDCPEADVRHGEATIERLASTVRARVRSRSQEALIAHLHDVLFDVYGLAGEEQEYYDPRNSYLPEVLERRRGLPITLTLVYKAVAQQLDVAVYGINAPGHFLAEVVAQGPQRRTSMYVDAFYGGVVLEPPEALERIAQTTGHPVAASRKLLARATHRQWLGRMLNNLQATFASAGRERDLLAMQELQQLLQ